MPVLTAEQTKLAETNAVKSGMTWAGLMENAGKSVADTVIKISPSVKSAVAVCGKGNNGGDGYVAARLLCEAGIPTAAIVLSAPKTDGAVENLEKAEKAGVGILFFDGNEDGCASLLGKTDVIIDAVFGTGFKGEPDDTTAKLIKLINGSPAYKISVDVPSGLHADDGSLPSVYVNPDMTVTFTSLKPCHILFPSCDRCGDVAVAEIGIADTDLPDEIFAQTVGIEYVKKHLPVRSKSSHKGTFGTAGLFVGSKGFAGAAILSSRAAVKSGAGIVNCIVPESIYTAVTVSVPEAVCTVYKDRRPMFISETVSKCTAGLVGCGLGLEKSTVKQVKKILKTCNIPLVIDADGINAVCGCIELVRQYKGDVIITPHPGEAARLLGCNISDIQKDRFGSVKKLAEITGAVSVLKGAYTLIATPDGKVFAVTDGNPGMATAGTGDMLAGMTVSFLAQGMTAIDAALSAVKLHAICGDRAVKRTSVPSLTPSDMIEELPEVFLDIAAK